MNKDVLPDDLVDDTIRLEVNLPIIRHADPIQLGRDMAPHGQVGKARTERFQLLQHVRCLPHRVMDCNVTVDVDQVVFRFF
jgi:hypothetical protein